MHFSAAVCFDDEVSLENDNQTKPAMFTAATFETRIFSRSFPLLRSLRDANTRKAALEIPTAMDESFKLLKNVRVRRNFRNIFNAVSVREFPSELSSLLEFI